MQNTVTKNLTTFAISEQRTPVVGRDGRTLEELQTALKRQVLAYKGDNAKLEAVLKKLHLLPSDLSCHLQTQLHKLTSVQEKYETETCNLEAIGLSHADVLRKQSNYVTKVKSCIKIYNSLNDKLSKDIKNARGELSRAEKNIAAISTLASEEVKTLQIKVDRYEKELLKFEKKYPWLSDPKFHLLNINKETELLSNLRISKEKLLQELQVYQGLKPDLSAAAQQLQDIEKEYESMI